MSRNFTSLTNLAKVGHYKSTWKCLILFQKHWNKVMLIKSGNLFGSDHKYAKELHKV